MKRSIATLIFTLTVFYSVQPLADSATAMQTDKFGVAIVVLADQENSLARNNPVYNRLIGMLQKSMKRESFLVYNGTLPPHNQPDWSRGMDAVIDAADRLDNPWVETMVVIIATTGPGRDRRMMEVALELRFLALSTKTVYRQLTQKSLVMTPEACAESCSRRLIDDELMQLSTAILPGLSFAKRSTFDNDEVVFGIAQR